MIEKEKKAIEYLKEVKSWWWHNSPDKAYAINLSDIEQFDILLNLIQKQEKVIDEMAKWIEHNGYYTYGYGNPTCDIIQDSCWNNDCLDRKKRDCQSCMKKYFYRKVDNNEN